MQKQTASFTITSNVIEFKQRMLNWANQFNICCFLDSHEYGDKYHSYDCLLGVGARTFFSPEKNVLQALKDFDTGHNDWLFGHIGYNLKNEIEQLKAGSIDNIGFPDIFLFEPMVVIELNENIATISSCKEAPQEIFECVDKYALQYLSSSSKNIVIQPRLSKNAYIEKIEKLKQHILRGDCYEINFCQEFFAEYADLDPLEVYTRLCEISPAPFAGYYKLNDKYLLCASPERYVKRTGNSIISQPIKGTSKRNLVDAVNDEQSWLGLKNSAKDKSENVMVVDLVRNDLSKVCRDGTVAVDELFGIYSFAQVHQMISTISGELNDNVCFANLLEATFPMGSMTGAPKKRVLELIEQYEAGERGIFSGAIGYIKPNKDFDFNVVIRSIMYNAAKGYVSYFAGGGITFYSDPENEYEECLIKAYAMERVLGGPGSY